MPALLAVCCGVAGAQEAKKPAPDPDAFDYVLGTQTIAPAYQFTKDTSLVETAKAIQAMGSNILKISLSADYAQKYPGVRADPSLHSLTDLAQKEPSFRRVLDMPFRYYLLWTYPFSSGGWQNALSEPSARAEYRELYAFTRYLLTRYNRSGKTFLLGHWEGDWYLHPGYDINKTPTPQALQSMTAWLNIRQKAVDDAKRDTPHANVQVYHYTEVNLVQKAMHGGTTLTNDVLPKTHVDFVSYSSYDSLRGEGKTLQDNLRKALDYIASKLPPKSGIPGRRVFIGEYGFPSERFDPLTQARRSRDVAVAGLEWGCPYVLYWEMVNNEVKDGRQRGFWLIDDKGQKQPVYDLHAQFLANARRFVADFLHRHGRVPTAEEFQKQAVSLLPNL